MKSRYLPIGLLLGLLPLQTPARDEMTLVGLAEIGGAKLAYVRLESAGQTLNLVQGETISGLRLLDSNAREGWAMLQQEPERFILRVASRSTGVSVASPTNGNVASADYIAALREYTRNLSVAEREPFQAELLRFHAAAASSGQTDPGKAVLDAAPDSLQQPGLDDAAERISLDSPQGQQLGVLLSVLSPAPGSRQGSGDEIAQLRRLRILQSDPAVRTRLLNELRAYAAPSN